MFQALKKHIMRERKKKKEEQEADAEVERQRLERELKQKQDDMSLGENLEQIAHLEKTLSMLKEEKHQLFLQLKKVLNEDDNRRRQLVRQQESEVNESYVGGGYNNVPNEQFANPPMSIQSYSRIIPSEHTLIPPGSLKRGRSPSPPHLQLAYSTGYGHSKSPAPPPPTRVTYSSSGHSSHSYNNSQFVMSSGGSSSHMHGRNEDTSTPPQRKQPLYLPQTQSARQFTPGIVTSNIHPQRYMQQHAGDHSKGMMSEEMFYPIPTYLSTSHVPLHGGGIPIQQPAQGVRTGGITSGFPIRPISSGLPHTHLVHSSSSPHVSSQHSVYVSQPSSMSGSRMAVNQIPSHNQPGSTSNRYSQREV